MFYTYCRRPLHKKYQNSYNAECPICKEGKSAGRSRRLFFFPNKGYFYCHNCADSWKPFEWVKIVTGMTVTEIIRRNKEKSQENEYKAPKQALEETKPVVVLPDLPSGSVDLTDSTQIEFYKNNKYVKLALEYCEKRRLFTAANRGKKFYVCLEDKVHKNRLVIPFYDSFERIVSYQTRALTSNQFPKYLTKFGEKELFGLEKLDSSINHVFVFEGPIDSMFVKNGIAMASLSPTEKQIKDIKSLVLYGYSPIYVFDNDKNNQHTSKKIQKYIEKGETIFLWPKELTKFKDLNEVCCALGIDEVSPNFIIKNARKGAEALIKHKLISPCL